MSITSVYAGLPGAVSGCLVEARGVEIFLCGSHHWVRGGTPWLPANSKPLLGARVDDLSEPSIRRFFDSISEGDLVDSLMDRGFRLFDDEGACRALAGWDEVLTSPPESWIFRFSGRVLEVSTTAVTEWEPMDADGEWLSGAGEIYTPVIFPPSPEDYWSPVVAIPTGTFDAGLLVELLKPHRDSTSPYQHGIRALLGSAQGE